MDEKEKKILEARLFALESEVRVLNSKLSDLYEYLATFEDRLKKVEGMLT